MHTEQTGCPSQPQARHEIEQAIHAFFDALRDEDGEALSRLTTESFYSFDVGKRFTGPELVDAVQEAHARGTELNWAVGPLDTKIDCNVAWSAWENSGSAGIPPNVRPVRWLESAVLIHRNDAWKIDFFHSQRASTP